MSISNRKRERKLRFAAIALSIAAAAGLAAGAQIAGAANVSGLMSYRDGSPGARRWLHYENRVTNDIYIAPTTPDGSFTADLPPGLYDLRAERGVILADKIRVDAEDVNIGHVVEPAPLDVRRPFESEGVGEALVESPAPSTANLGGRASRGDDVRTRSDGSARSAGDTRAAIHPAWRGYAGSGRVACDDAGALAAHIRTQGHAALLAAEHIGAWNAGFGEGFFAIRRRRTAHIAFHVGEAWAAAASANMCAGRADRQVARPDRSNLLAAAENISRCR